VTARINGTPTPATLLATRLHDLFGTFAKRHGLSRRQEHSHTTYFIIGGHVEKIVVFFKQLHFV
jgi:hypothetical protein